MTLENLQKIVLRLANSAPVRYWIHFNYPIQEPWLMAIKLDRSLISTAHLEANMEKIGGCWLDIHQVWSFERTNEDGTPFGSTL